MENEGRLQIVVAGDIDIDRFADSLMELVENTYPEAAYSFEVELARDQFIQGVTISDDIRERIFVSQPSSLVEAVCVVRHLESARKACRAVPAVEQRNLLMRLVSQRITRKFQLR